MFTGYLEYYLMGILLLPGIILAIYAQAKVTKTFNKFNKIKNTQGLTGSDVADKITKSYGINDIKITKSHGKLSDHYNHRNKTIALSPEVHDSTSLSAIGVAAHEAGHALQYKDNYLPVKLRSFLVPFSNIISSLLWPLVFIGILLNVGAYASTSFSMVFIWSGIILFSISVIVNLITLPVELNASKRANKQLEKTVLMSPEETSKAKKVLKAAALTYVAALVVSILNLLRFILYSTRR